MIESGEDHRKRIFSIMHKAQKEIEAYSVVSLPAHIRTIEQFGDWLEQNPNVRVDQAYFDPEKNCIMVKLIDQDLIPF